MKKPAEERIREHLVNEFKDFEVTADEVHWGKIHSKTAISRRMVRVRYTLAALLILISGVFTMIYYESQHGTDQHSMAETETHSGKEKEVASINSSSERKQLIKGNDNTAEIIPFQAPITTEALPIEPSDLRREKLDDDNIETIGSSPYAQVEKLLARTPEQLAGLPPLSLEERLLFPSTSRPQTSRRMGWSWQLEIGASVSFANLQPNTSDDIVFDLYRNGVDLGFDRIGWSPTVLINRVISPRWNLALGAGIHWRQFNISEDYGILNEFGERLEGDRLVESLSIWSASITPMLEHSLSMNSNPTWIQVGLEYEPWIGATSVASALLDIPDHEINVILGARRQIIRRSEGAGYLRGYGYYALNRRYTSSALRVVPYGFVIAIGWQFSR
ncbi:MAG: hypothetical protein RIC80_06425 [Cyclobacteriaceae bacterium]